MRTNPTPRLNKRYAWTFFWLVVLSFAVNYLAVYYITYPLDYVYSDMRGYVERAWDLAAGGPLPKFHAFYPPGNAYFYALLMSLLGFSAALPVIIALQVLLLTAAQLLFALSARLLFASNGLACLALFGMALYFPFALQGSFFMSEPLFCFFMALASYLYLLQATTSGGRAAMLLVGLAISAAALVKGQGWALAPAVLLPALVLQNVRHLRRYLPYAVAGMLIVLPLQFAVNSAILGKRSTFLSANDAYNFYLGHSRRAAIGCYHPDTGTYYIFHHNNTALWNSFREPEVVSAHIWERDLFLQKTAELWSDDPLRQLLIGAANVIEILKINPTWPSRSNPSANKYELWSKGWAFYLVTLPALYAVFDAALRRRYRFQVLFLGLPPAAMLGIAFISMGQPRYWIAFQYFLFLLALPWYRDLAQIVTTPKGKP